jgi:hypothetical protein
MVEKVFSEKDLRIQPINVINRQNRRGCDKGFLNGRDPVAPQSGTGSPVIAIHGKIIGEAERCIITVRRREKIG